MDKVSSRRYGLVVGQVTLTPSQLDEIRSLANRTLLDNAGFEVSTAWVSATVNYLIKLGAIQVPVEREGGNNEA